MKSDPFSSSECATGNAEDARSSARPPVRALEAWNISAIRHEVLNLLTVLIGKILLLLRKREDGSNPVQILSDITRGWPRMQGGSGPELTAFIEQYGAERLREDIQDSQSLVEILSEWEGHLIRDLKLVENAARSAAALLDRNRLFDDTPRASEPISLERVLREAVAARKPSLEERGIRVHQQMDPQLPMVQADPDDLLRIFLNLIINAEQAMDSEGELIVGLTLEEKRVAARITDNGAGIELPQEILERVFEQGYTSKTPDEGVGIGLSISRYLARSFDGDVEIESSNPGTGTTFLVWFPIAE